MRRTLLVLAGAALVAIVLASSAAANHSWGGYHWARTSNPFTINLGDNVSSAWDSYLQTAAGDWSANTAGNPLNATVVAGAGRGKCGATWGRVEVCSDTYGPNGWLGLAQIWVAADLHITRAIAKMNDTYYNTPKYDTPFWRGAVMCQEVGHTFGLDHQDTSGADFHTCMDYATNPDADNTHPNRHDYEELALIYSHLDGSTTIGSSTRGAGAARVTRIDHVGKSMIVRHFADGSQQITFIIWAN
jgi:hypothetical protein